MAAMLCLAVVAVLFGGAVAQIPMPTQKDPVVYTDKQYFQLALNLEYLEAEFYLKSAFGYGVEGVNKTLTGGGPDSLGGHKAVLNAETFQICKMLALQEVGHIRIIREFLGSETINRPKIDISVATWTHIMKVASKGAITHFDPYTGGSLSWLLAAYALPYVGLTAYVGTNPNLKTMEAKALLGGVLGVEGGQDAVLRTALWERRLKSVPPTNKEVQYFTGIISKLRNSLDGSHVRDDENIEVPKHEGAEHRISVNILSANTDSLSFARSAFETILILYGTNSTGKPGGFYPNGVEGVIGKYNLEHPKIGMYNDAPSIATT